MDPSFPENFKRLGYFINETGHIKNIEHPEEDFQFWINTNIRYNDLQREAMHSCIRKEVGNRLTSLGVPAFYLPQMDPTQPDPPTTASLPIHCTPPNLLRTKRRVVVICNRAYEDLAIWSYRVLAKAGGVEVGSAVAFIREMRLRAEKAALRTKRSVEDEMPGVVLLNTGQLLYSYKKRSALSPVSWDALPRKSLLHPAPRIDDKWNRIEGNESIKEHVEFVFGRIVGNEDFVQRDADVYVVGIHDGGEEVTKYLNSKWPTAHPNIKALALAAPLPVHSTDAPVPLTAGNSPETPNPFLHFLAARTRAWSLTPYPTNTPIANADPLPEVLSLHHAATTIPTSKKSRAQYERENREINLWPSVSGGDGEYAEAVLTKAYGGVLDWFEEVAGGDAAGGYANGQMDIADEVRVLFSGMVMEDYFRGGVQGGGDGVGEGVLEQEAVD